MSSTKATVMSRGLLQLPITVCGISDTPCTGLVVFVSGGDRRLQGSGDGTTYQAGQKTAGSRCPGGCTCGA